MEKLEKEVIRNCRLLRARADRKALRRKVRQASLSGEKTPTGLKLPSLTSILERIPNLIRC